MAVVKKKNIFLDSGPKKRGDTLVKVDQTISNKFMGSAKNIAIGGISTGYGGMEKMLAHEYSLCRHHGLESKLFVSEAAVKRSLEGDFGTENISILHYSPLAILRTSNQNFINQLKLRFLHKYTKGLKSIDGYSVGISGYLFGPELLALATELEKPAIATVHGYLAPVNSNDRVLKEKLRHCFKNLRGLCAVSDDSMAAYLAIFESLLPVDLSFSIVENFAEDSYFLLGQDKIQTVLNRNSKGPLKILTAGRIVQQKRIDQVIEVFQILNSKHGDITLKIAGKGDDLIHLENKVRDLKLESHISFLGYSDLKPSLSEADIFVTATQREGGSSLVVAEALASALPVFAFHAPGISEALSNCSGALLVANRSSSDMAAAILNVYEDRNKLKNMCHSAYAFAKQKYQKNRWADQRWRFQQTLWN